MTVIDLFAGAVGGWSTGLARAGYRTVAACELDPWRRAVFQANHPEAIVYDDVRTLTAERLRADLGYLPSVVVGSPPCQEISAANCKGTGITDDHLFWEAVRLIFEIRPVWCALENSPRSRTEGIDGILDALGRAGYACWPCVVGADNAGANHRRKRLWLVAADALPHDGHGESGSTLRPSAGQGGSDPRGPDAGDAAGERCEEGFTSAGQRAQGADAGGNGNARHTESVARLRLGGTRGRRGRTEPAQARLHDAADASCTGTESAEQSGQLHCDLGKSGGHAANANGTRHALGPRLGSDDGEELPAALREIGLRWPAWNGGLAGLAASCAAAGFGDVDDGCTNGMAPGLRNRAIAALGDAVVSNIPEAIGRAMTALIDGRSPNHNHQPPE